MRKNTSVSPAYSPSPLGPSMNTAVMAQSQMPSSENKKQFIHLSSDTKTFISAEKLL